jgi:hypothetical protein
MLQAWLKQTAILNFPFVSLYPTLTVRKGPLNNFSAIAQPSQSLSART